MGVQADHAGRRQRVQVAIADPSGLSVSKAWEVEVAPAEPTPPPLRIVEAQPDSPPDAVIALKEGGAQRFSVDVSGGSGRPLRYTWYLEGRQQATKPTWTYRPDFGQGEKKTKRIQVSVSDPQGNRVERFWQVRVEDVNRPPQIVGFTPEQRSLDIVSGSSQRFSIEVADADRADQLQYAWLLDGKLLGRERSFDFPETVVPGKHTLEGRVSDPAQATATQHWNVAVLAPAAPPAMIERPLKKPPSPPIEEAEVKAWLDSYRSAWENKDINALIGLGEVTHANAAKLRGVLAGYGDFRVELKELQIQIEGTRAQVSFRRADIIDGKKLVQPERKMYVFVKQANGDLRSHKVAEEIELPRPSPGLADDVERMRRRDAYLARLKEASYAFNPPSPISVAEPRTVHFWIDPLADKALADDLRRVVPEDATLADDLRQVVPEDAARVETGRPRWSPRMRATLTGEYFDITPNEPGGKSFDGIKDLSATQRTRWSWDIEPKRPGDGLQLHLTLAVVLPPELGDPPEVTVLHRKIDVEATLWWWIDTYWEKYWKWILGGLASAVASALAYWWKNRKKKEGAGPPTRLLRKGLGVDLLERRDY